MYIYQIGNLRLPVASTTIASRVETTSRSFRHAETVLSHVPGAVWQGNAARPLVKSSDYTIKGTLVCGLNGCETIDEEINQFLALAGVPYVPIIAFVPQGDCGGECPDCCAKYPDLWLLTYGEITSVSRVRDDSKVSHEDMTPIEIKIRTLPYWEGLDDIRWRYYDQAAPLQELRPSITSTPPTKHYHPYQMFLDWVVNKHGRGAFFENSFDDTVYGDGPLETDPANWYYAYYTDVPDATTRAVLPSNDPTAMWKPLGIIDHEFVVPNLAWSAPPRSLYMFTNLPTSGDLTIEVTAKTRSNVSVHHISTLNLANLNNNLIAAGLSGIQTTDRLLVGNTYYPGGALMRLSGGVYQRVSVFVPWSYSALYPGETTNYFNKVEIDGPSGVTGSYVHIFRRL